jgi:hypothetical protein
MSLWGKGGCGTTAHYGPIVLPLDDTKLNTKHCWIDNWWEETEILEANNVPVPRGPKFVPLPFCSNAVLVPFCRNRVPMSRPSKTSPSPCPKQIAHWLLLY